MICPHNCCCIALRTVRNENVCWLCGANAFLLSHCWELGLASSHRLHSHTPSFHLFRHLCVRELSNYFLNWFLFCKCFFFFTKKEWKFHTFIQPQYQSVCFVDKITDKDKLYLNFVFSSIPISKTNTKMIDNTIE